MARQRKISARAGSAASKVLKDGRTGRKSKIAASSALSQRAPKRKNNLQKNGFKNSFFFNKIVFGVIAKQIQKIFFEFHTQFFI